MSAWSVPSIMVNSDATLSNMRHLSLLAVYAVSDELTDVQRTKISYTGSITICQSGARLYYFKCLKCDVSAGRLALCRSALKKGMRNRRLRLRKQANDVQCLDIFVLSAYAPGSSHLSFIRLDSIAKSMCNTFNL